MLAASVLLPLSLTSQAIAESAPDKTPGYDPSKTIVSNFYLLERPQKISADGRTIIGEAISDKKDSAIWTGGLLARRLKTLGASSGAYAQAVSRDGSVIVGSAYGLVGNDQRGYLHAVAWRNGSTTPIDLGAGPDGGSQSIATGVSADGSIIVGSFTQGGFHGEFKRQAAYWANGATTPTQLQPLPGKNYATADIVSADGSIIVGQSDFYPCDPITQCHQRATAWKKGSFTPIDLGGLGGDVSIPRGVSANGAVIVGSAALPDRNHRAVSWTDGATTPTNLGAMPGKRGSFATAVSANGLVIIGVASNEIPVSYRIEPELREIRIDNQGLVWVNGATKPTVLGILPGGRNSFAAAVSADGSVIVGTSNSLRNNHAVMWINGSPTPIPLGPIGDRSSSTAYAVSADGSVIAGRAYSPDTGNLTTLWKIVPPNFKPEPDPTVDPQPDPKTDPKTDPKIDPKTDPSDCGPDYRRCIVMIDVDSTLRSVGQFANDTFTVMEMQRLALRRLQDGCTVSAPGQTCYALTSGAGKLGGDSDMSSGFVLGHAFTDRFSAGVSLANSLQRNLPGTFDRTHNNIGGGLYAQFAGGMGPANWYVRGSLAANRYDVARSRDRLGYTEAGAGDSAMKGWSASLELGRTHALEHSAALGYRVGLRHSDIRLAGYSENNAAFPFTYSGTRYLPTTAYLGASYAMPVASRFTWSLDADVEYDVARGAPSMSAQADYIGRFDMPSDFTRTRANLSTTLSYAVNNRMNIGLTPYVGRASTRDALYGAMVSLNGTF